MTEKDNTPELFRLVPVVTFLHGVTMYKHPSIKAIVGVRDTDVDRKDTGRHDII